MKDAQKNKADRRIIYLAKINLVCVSLFMLLFSFNNRYFTFLLAPWLFVSVVYAIVDRFRFKEILLKSVWFLVFYGISLISLLYSSDIIKGIKVLEIMVSLSFMPFLMIVLQTSLLKLKRGTALLIDLYILGLLIYILASLVTLFFKWDMESISAYFETQSLLHATSFSKLSVFQHRVYISLFMVWGIVLLLHRNLDKPKSKKALIHFCIAVVLGVYIVLLGSRAALLILLLVIMFFLWQYFRRVSLLASLMVSILALSLSAFALNKYTRVGKTLRKMDNTEFDVKDNRIPLWTSACDGVKAAPFFGHGIGDGLHVLLEVHKKKGLDKAYRLKANAHNQFLETMLHTGIPGLLSLLLLLFIPLRNALKHKHELLMVLMTVIIINLLFESMLVRLSGVLFIGFWINFLCLFPEDVPQEDV